MKQKTIKHQHIETLDNEAGVPFRPSIEWDMEFMSVTAELVEELKTLTGMLFYEGYNRQKLGEINEKIEKYDDLMNERKK